MEVHGRSGASRGSRAEPPLFGRSGEWVAIDRRGTSGVDSSADVYSGTWLGLGVIIAESLSAICRCRPSATCW